MRFPRRRAAAPTVALLATLLVGCPGGGDAPGGAPQSPPVLLITVDGLVAEGLSAFGGDRDAPGLDSLVSSAIVWRDGWTASPVTRAAVATYLTGLAPDRHGVVDDVSSRLAEDLPTLATLLAARGYATAAFPGSSLLRSPSGLLRGFEIVDDPPPPPIGPPSRIPVTTPADETAEHFALWLKGVAPDAPWFAWVHFSGPLLEQLDDLGKRSFGASEARLLGKLRARALEEESRRRAPAPEAEGDAEETVPDGLAAFDAAVGEILAALDVRGGPERVLLLLAPTMGDVGGGASDPPGPGLSLGQQAVGVPYVVRFPAGAPPCRPTDLPVWAPDLPATVAALTGATLSPDAEGLSLLQSPPADRTLLAWSWATRDQMGWLPLRAARSGAWKRIEGLEDGTFRMDGAPGASDPEAESALVGALRARAEVPRDEVDLETVRPWLEANGFVLKPLPPEGRAFGPAEARRDAAALVWNARNEFRERSFELCLVSWRGALESDPDNLAAMLGAGQTLNMGGNPQSQGVLRRAVELYPGDWDLLHWFGHTIWKDSWRSVEKLYVAILPHRPDDPDVLYDLACARSMDDDPAAAEDFLRAALDAGFQDWNLVESDSDLRNLRATPRFSALLREYGR